MYSSISFDSCVASRATSARSLNPTRYRGPSRILASATALAVGRVGAELLVGVGPLRVGDGPDDRVRGGEDPGPGTEVRIQGEASGRRSFRPREPLGELEQVVERGAAPRVDVLVRVA